MNRKPMHPNAQLLHDFYAAFAKRDYATMQQCYAPNATFSDPVFRDLTAAEVKAMWEMLCKTGKDLRIEFRHVQADDRNGSAEWTAWYTFSRSGKKVENRIKAHFVFENGKIVQHTDVFSFYRWARQALGFAGLLLGWLPSTKAKVRRAAMGNLKSFMKSESGSKEQL